MHIGIVADDLTGAADSVAPFAQRGLRANVGFEQKFSIPRFRLETGDALAYDTETRDIASAMAGGIPFSVRRAVQRLAALRPTVIYKKIDSTLRGHLRLELDAMRYELPDRLAVICPAFPANGRTLHSGVLHIHGVPWTATDFAPVFQLDEPTVRGAFGAAQDRTSAELAGSVLRRGAKAVEANFERLRAAGIQMVFCDAQDQDHLMVLAQVVLNRPEAYLPVGSAGWTHAFALLSSQAFTQQTLFGRLIGRVLVIVGSLHQASRKQSCFLSARRGTSPIVLSHTASYRSDLDRAVDGLWALFRAGQRIALLTTPDLPEREANDEWTALAGSVVRRICERSLRADQPIEGLVVSGGKTAVDICQALNGLGLRIQGEIQPGVVMAQLYGEADPATGVSFDGLPIITKAGGFGTETTLAECVGS